MNVPDSARAATSRDSAPLSLAQSRLWLLDRLHPGESAYHEPQLLRLSGPLDPQALRRALNDVLRRHDALRTRFPLSAGEPVQVVVPALELALDVEDLRGHATPEVEARRRAAADARAPFDLARGPLLRARLLRLRDTEHWLALTLHHIVTDGWSMRVLWHEIAAGYAAHRAGEPSPLPPLPIQYADYATAQRASIAGDAERRALDWWTRELEGAPALELVVDRPRSPDADRRGGRVEFRIEAPVVRALGAIARRARATPFMTLLAAYMVLLHRSTGQDDIAIGVPAAGRDRIELEPLIGFFVNMLVMRGDLSGQPGFDRLLERVRARALDAYERASTPFEAIVGALAPVRDPSRNPLFQATFALHRASASWAMGDLEVEWLDADAATDAKFDLGLTLVETDGELRGSFDYAAALFDASTIEGMAARFCTLVRAIADDPSRSIAQLALEDPASRARRVEATFRRDRYVPPAARVEALVARRALDQPDAIAVVDAKTPLTYGALAGRARSLALALREHGAGRSRAVGVCLERGPDLVVAMLAALEAGAAYVPLDPELPQERLRFILDDASVAVVVTDERLAMRLPEGAHRVLRVDRDAASIAARSPGAGAAPPDADEVACVMYTSGSTGRPKGVRVPHRAVMGLVCDVDYVSLSSADAIGMMSNPAFDAATFEVWGALVHGARLVPIDKATAIAPRALAARLRAEGVTTLFTTTALFEMVAREAPSAFAGVRQLLFGGEVSDPRRVGDVLRAGPPARLLHVYGPTETTTFATWHVVTEADAARASIPIGRAIAHAEVAVLDAEGELAPVDVPGEIHVGGAGVALGYLGAPELSAERFVPNRHSRDPEARLYRTGDRGRVRGDGEIEFLGRRDRQVKIRGHRIELDEVQAAIARVPGVRDAVVLARGSTSDQRRIVAWLVPANPDLPPPADLRRELRRVLPDYMLPDATVWVPALPIGPNGKLDLRALPEPGAAARRGDGRAVPPRDMFEGVLARLWEEVLGVRGIGVFDHFFEIGGHSLLAARLVDAIERETGFAVPLTALFRDDTIDGLARAMREGALAPGAPIVAVHPEGARPPFAFLHGDFTAGGFYSAALARALGADQPTLIVHPHGLAGDAVPESIEAMAAERLDALSAHAGRMPRVLGGHCNGALIAFEMARQLAARGEPVDAVVLIESRAPSPDAAPDEAGGSYLKLDANGQPRVLTGRDRASAIEIAYTRAIDRYRGGRCDAHLVVVQAREGRDPAPDAGWSRFARSWEGHVVPGDHVTLITRHLPELARTIREAIGRSASERAQPGSPSIIPAR